VLQTYSQAPRNFLTFYESVGSSNKLESFWRYAHANGLKMNRKFNYLSELVMKEEEEQQKQKQACSTTAIAKLRAIFADATSGTACGEGSYWGPVLVLPEECMRSFSVYNTRNGAQGGSLSALEEYFNPQTEAGKACKAHAERQKLRGVASRHKGEAGRLLDKWNTGGAGGCAGANSQGLRRRIDSLESRGVM
jgi:hypothetical protein